MSTREFRQILEIIFSSGAVFVTRQDDGPLEVDLLGSSEKAVLDLAQAVDQMLTWPRYCAEALRHPPRWVPETVSDLRDSDPRAEHDVVAVGPPALVGWSWPMARC